MNLLRSDLDTEETARNFSRTRFNEEQDKVFLGADAFPGEGVDANRHQEEEGNEES